MWEVNLHSDVIDIFCKIKIVKSILINLILSDL